MSGEHIARAPAAGDKDEQIVKDLGVEAPPLPPPAAQTMFSLERLRSYSAFGLLLLAVVYTLFFAQAILMPIAVAGLLALLLAPLVRALRRIRLPSPVGAAVVLVALLALVGGGIAMLSEPAALWTAELPKVSKKLEAKFRALRAPLEDMRQAGQQVDKLTTLESPKDVPQRVVVEEGGLFSRTMGLLQSLGTTLGILFALLFFLLASGDLFRRKLQQILPEHRGERAVLLVRDVQRNLSAYLVTITLINIGLGIATGTAMYLLGMPNPVLWGAMAAVLNFVPVVGPAVGVVVIALVGLISFPSMLDGVIPAAAYLGLHLTELQTSRPTSSAAG